MRNIKADVKEIVKSLKQVRKSDTRSGIAALFSGASGTGKKMAAQALATDMKTELYQVDLSSVVSKYIGETEKNLSKVFKTAQAKNAIPLFDEADALFGKRTNVNDAHDRYDNIDVNHLLQRIEEYSGLVILTTNTKKQLDEALKRRLRFFVKFS